MEKPNTKPLFTLTAEEVEVVKHYLTSTLEYKVFLGHNLDIRQLTKMKELEKILTRIKQWQDEQKNNNND